MTEHGAENRVKSGETQFTIVETIQELGTATVTELTAETDVAKSTVYRHLTTLEDSG